MFDSIENAPPDPIFALMHQFKRDPRENKVNLTVGVFQDEKGNTPILKCVKEAERKVLETETSKSYLGMAGDPHFNELTRDLVLGKDHPAVREARAHTIQTPGGTGALRIVGEFLAEHNADRRLWCSDPTWPNHLAIFHATGLEIERYEYLNEDRTALDVDACLEKIASIPARDAILLHTCCHNPTGFDPNHEQWNQILDAIAARELVVVFDFAYQGFDQTTEEDARPIREAIERGLTVFICNSYSKNLGLYAERIGGLTVVADSSNIGKALASQMKAYARTIYSNPPLHGAAIVNQVLGDRALKQQWQTELGEMRDRLKRLRQLFADRLAAKIPDANFQYIREQHGMFGMAGLTPEQADQLREEHAVYMLRSGRINIAGITDDNVDPLCDAIASVLAVSVSN